MIGVLGAGQLGQALLLNWLKHGVFDQNQLIFSTRSENSRNLVDQKISGLGYPALWSTTDNEALVRKAQVIVLAVKPSKLNEVCASISSLDLNGKLIISLVAGMKSCDIVKYFDGKINLQIIRAMPNLACQTGDGIAIICNCGNTLIEEHSLLIRTMFSKTGLLLYEENEDLMDAYTALCASTPAFYALFTDAIADGAVLMGIPRQKALQLAIQSLLGTARLLKNGIEKNCSGSEASELIHNVCTPAGCTIQGIYDLQKNAVPGHIMQALESSCNAFKK